MCLRIGASDPYCRGLVSSADPQTPSRPEWGSLGSPLVNKRLQGSALSLKSDTLGNATGTVVRWPWAPIPAPFLSLRTSGSPQSLQSLEEEVGIINSNYLRVLQRD